MNLRKEIPTRTPFLVFLKACLMFCLRRNAFNISLVKWSRLSVIFRIELMTFETLFIYIFLIICLFTGLSDIPGEAMVKLYCPKCMDVYTPKSSRHHHTDGAYFGTGFPHMLFMVHPEYRPKRPANQFVPRFVSQSRHAVWR